MIPYLGEILSVAAAALWALAIVLFKLSGERVHPVALNTFKNMLCGLLLVPTIYLTGGTLFHPETSANYWLLVASGVIGLSIADTLVFQCLNMIGAGRTALVYCLYSPVIILLSYLFIAERLTVMQLVGVALILLAILETANFREEIDADRRRRFLGVMIGVLGMISMGTAVVMIKPLLDRSPLLWAIEIRIIGGVVALWIYLAFHPARKKILSTLLVRERRVVTVSSSVIGGYIAMICWLGGMKLTQASVASSLGQTNTIFTLIFAAIVLRERITFLRALAIVVATAGALMVIFG